MSRVSRGCCGAGSVLPAPVAKADGRFHLSQSENRVLGGSVGCGLLLVGPALTILTLSLPQWQSVTEPNSRAQFNGANR